MLANFDLEPVKTFLGLAAWVCGYFNDKSVIRCTSLINMSGHVFQRQLDDSFQLVIILLEQMEHTDGFG